MDAIETITGPVTVLMRDDIDTDQIIPARYMKRVERTGFGEFCFHEWRAQGVDIPSNPILVSGVNFGCGSSREHAPWALKDYGFKAVLSSRFADIFRGNSGKQGLLAAQVAQDDIELIWKVLENNPGAEVKVDLVSKTVECGNVVAPFEIDDYTRWRLLEGLDDIGLTLQHEADITAYEATRPSFKPTTLPARS